MTDLARFQDELREQGYTQVPRTELMAKTYAIVGTDIFVVNGEFVDRYFFTTEGKASGVKMKDKPLEHMYIIPKKGEGRRSAVAPQLKVVNEKEE